MLVLPQTVQVRWGCNKKYFEGKGYIYTKKGDYFDVNVLDLSPRAEYRVNFVCDYCGKKFDKNWKDYKISLEESIIQKDACYDCRKYKSKESNIINFGVEHTSQLEEVTNKRKKYFKDNYNSKMGFGNKQIFDKAKNTMMDKYGTTIPLLLPEFIEKAKNTNLDKYGCENPFENEDIKEKIRQTNLIKYGCEYVSQNEDVKEKFRHTCLENFGYDHPSKCPEILEKIIYSKYKNNSCPTSSQQLYLYNLLGGILNYPVKTLSLDIAFPEEKIYIEYDGSGHDLRVKHKLINKEEFDKLEIKRNYALYRSGWKGIRIISKNDKLPSDDVILLMIEFAKDYINTGHSWINFDIDNKIIYCSNFKIKCDFGKLRYIKKYNVEQVI